jgi:prephenate dehydrogenase
MLIQDKEMFCAMFEANPHAQEAVRAFRGMLNLAAGGDVDLLAERARWWWRGDFSDGGA